VSLLYTYKNIGTCYLGIGQSDMARKYFEDCIKIVKTAPTDVDKESIKRKDQEEIAQLYQNMYMTHISDRQYLDAIDKSEKALEILVDLYGPRAKRIASKYYQIANSNLLLQNKKQAIINIEKAISIHEKPDADKDDTSVEKEGVAPSPISVEAQNFNRIQY